MSAFPKLKTAAVAQYPATRQSRFRNETHGFLDGSEQRFRDFRGVQRRWVIDLTQLDAGEAAVLSDFFIEQKGRLGSFDFEDPWTGAVVTGCRFESDELPILAEGESDIKTSVTIVEPAL